MNAGSARGGDPSGAATSGAASAPASQAADARPESGRRLLRSGTVPRVADDYVTLLEAVLGAQVEPSADARAVVLRCLSGLGVGTLAERLPGAHLVGVEHDRAALAVARRRVELGGEGWSVVAAHPAATGLPASAFSHGAVVALPWAASARRALVAELGRLVAPHGQALVVTPVRGAFGEVFDLLRELAVRDDVPALARAVDAVAAALPTADELGADLAAAGFGHGEARLLASRLLYTSGGAFTADPAMRALVLPELTASLGSVWPEHALRYVESAIDAYFAEGVFDLTVRVACVSGRRLG